MIFDHARAWPHPVLSPLSDDILPNEFDFDLSVDAEHGSWRIGASGRYSDSALSILVSKGDAHFLLHLECKRTYYRAAWASSNSDWTIRVPDQNLYGQVEASFLLIAARDIDAYCHPAQHVDFRNTAFNVGVGEPLAVAISKTFDAYLDLDPILRLSSIIDIQKGTDANDLMEVQSEGDRIVLILPPSDFERYKMLRAGPAVRGLLATSVVLPALLQAFNYLGRLEPDDFERFKDEHRWTRSVIPRLDQMNIDLRNWNARENTALHAAQRLLHGPLARSLGDVQNMMDSVA
jgi:hypothetical protein